MYSRKTEVKYFCHEGLTMESLSNRLANFDFFAHAILHIASTVMARIGSINLPGRITSRKMRRAAAAGRSQPKMGVPTHEPTIRRLTALPYPLLIFYEIAGDEIIIHAVRHAARDPSDMPGSEEPLERNGLSK
jgi:hypothetical protein